MLICEGLNLKLILTSSGIRPQQEFFTLVEQQYGVRPKGLLGGTRDTKDINDWVSQETGGKVQRLLAKALPRNPGVNTVSASYFKGKSQNPQIVELSSRTLVPMFSFQQFPVCKQGSG